ncbi:MAG: alkyl hydroperoxide reductase AhpD [Candidatus Hinthialibacteria bacterium]|nr:carboxymuconolactone decarboxylase family protein [bacterium]
MEKGIDYAKTCPQAIEAMWKVEQYVRQCGLEHSLLELVKTRASQINGCAYCIDMHTKDARAGGESEMRLYVLSAWREAPFYSERERAALAWTEAVTLLSNGPIPGDVEEEARRQFTDKELVDLTMAIVAINSWNRLAVPFHAEAGTYQPGRLKPPSS